MNLDFRLSTSLRHAALKHRCRWVHDLCYFRISSGKGSFLKEKPTLNCVCRDYFVNLHHINSKDANERIL